MEFPCFGVPAIVAGSGRYSGLGFTVDPSSREEYFAILARLETLPRLTPEQRTLARKHFDGLMRLRQVSFEDAAHMDLKKLHEAQSDVHDNLRILPRSLDEFQRASSFRRLAEWLDESQEEDFCAWPIVSEVAPQ
jgi:hypothetical protein